MSYASSYPRTLQNNTAAGIVKFGYHCSCSFIISLPLGRLIFRGTLNYFWKSIGVLLILYTLTYGLWVKVPALPILHETIRNLFFHVTMWFTMIFLYGLSLYHSIYYLRHYQPASDIKASAAVRVGIIFGVTGLLTGSLWARFTWGTWWTNDPQLNGAAITMLSYFAYFFLRQSIRDEDKRARISAVYNIFAFVMMMVFIGILPRLTDSLHPGKGGNPGFNTYDMDATLRTVFYPALAGWVIIGLWLWNISFKIKQIEAFYENKQHN